MAKNNNRKRSFFEEQRNQNANPNFFNTVDISFIRNNVRRIIRDAAENIILDEDYIYFKNSNILNACLQESAEQLQSAQTIRHALTAYRTIILPRGMITPDVDINIDYIVTAAEITKITNKENVWAAANKIFKDIANNADPKSCLIFLSRFPQQVIKSI